MPRHDIYHDCVRNALIKDGWKIMHDPLTIPFGADDLFVDLGAELRLAAVKAGRKIAVEIKSFRGPSEMADLQQARGQYRIYRFALGRMEPDRTCFLAIPEAAYTAVFGSVDLIELIPSEDLNLIVFGIEREEIVSWKPAPT